MGKLIYLTDEEAQFIIDCLGGSGEELGDKIISMLESFLSKGKDISEMSLQEYTDYRAKTTIVELANRAIEEVENGCIL